jgi:hypothetical protein
MNIQENIITDYLLNMKLIDILGKYKPAHPTLSIYLIRKILIDNNITNRGRYSKYKALINNEPQPIAPLINVVIPNNSTPSLQSQSTPTNAKQRQTTPNKINSITDADVDAIVKPVKKPRQPRKPRQPKQNIKSIDTDNVVKIDDINKVNLVCFPKSQELILKSKQMRANRKK